MSRAARIRSFAGLAATALFGAVIVILLLDDEPPVGQDAPEVPMHEERSAAATVDSGPSRRELDVTADGERVRRAAEGPGVQGWLHVEGAPLPKQLFALGPSLPSGGRIAVSEDGHFAIPDAIAGSRYMLRLPDGVVSSWSPTDDSVVGSSYVHLLAPARVDVYAQTLASAMQFTLLLPGGEPAAWRRAQVTVDGERVRVMTVETDQAGNAVVPLPLDGWWTNASITPQPEEGVLYERFWIARMDLPTSGVAGVCRMKRADSVTYQFFDVENRPVADVRAAPPSTGTVSGGDGQLVLLKQDAGRVRWEHPNLDASRRSTIGPESLLQIPAVRMVPRGSVTWLCPDAEARNDYRLELMPGMYSDDPTNNPVSWENQPRSLSRKEGARDWRSENVDVAPGDGLMLSWRGNDYWEGPAEYGYGEALRSLPKPLIRQYSVTIYGSDGSPASRVRLRNRSVTIGRTDDSGALTFDLPDAQGDSFVWVDAANGLISYRYPHDASGRASLPPVIRLPELKSLLIQVESHPPQVRSVSLAVETEWGGALVNRNLSWSRASENAGVFPVGRRLYRITPRSGVTIEAWHDTASEQPLTIVLPQSEER